MSTEPDIISALDQLETSLRTTGLELDLGAAADARAERDELADQISDYLIPRLRRLDAPLLVVLGCLLYTSPSPRDATLSRMPSSA